MMVLWPGAVKVRAFQILFLFPETKSSLRRIYTQGQQIFTHHKKGKQCVSLSVPSPVTRTIPATVTVSPGTQLSHRSEVRWHSTVRGIRPVSLCSPPISSCTLKYQKRCFGSEYFLNNAFHNISKCSEGFLSYSISHVSPNCLPWSFFTKTHDVLTWWSASRQFE